MIELDTLYNEDCLEGMQRIPDGSVDCVICDLPYGTMKGMGVGTQYEGKTEWDDIIPTDKLFEQYERVLRRGGVAVLFSQDPYTLHLRTFKARNISYLYPMIWKKDQHGNVLIVDKAPLNYFEDISVFAKANPLHDYDLAHPLREYFAKVLDFIKVPKIQLMREFGTRIDHTFRVNSSQFALCTAETYEDLNSRYHLDKMDGYQTYKELKAVDDAFVIKKEHERTFNLPEGEKYLSNVLEFSKDTDGFHPTQKPVALIRRLVLTYTNEGDTVLDNCMGSGTTAKVARALGRHYIGFEISAEYCDIINKRLEQTKTLFDL